MEIILSKFKKHEHSSAFDDFRLYMKPIVDSAVGWDENFQRTSFESKLKPEWFSWILCNGEKVGYTCSGTVKVLAVLRDTPACPHMFAGFFMRRF